MPYEEEAKNLDESISQGIKLKIPDSELKTSRFYPYDLVHYSAT